MENTTEYQKQEKNKPPIANRIRLFDERRSITHKFTLFTKEEDYDGYIIIGFYEDGSPGELFINVSKIGSLVQGLLDQLATCISIALQHGIPLDVFVKKFIDTGFAPNGTTSNKDIIFAKSISDYIFKYLGKKYCGLD